MGSIAFKNIIEHLKLQSAAKWSLIVLIVFFIACALAFLSPFDPNLGIVKERYISPNTTHWFGTDKYGRDYFTRALYGGRISLLVGFLSMLISVSLGTLIGTLAGYFSGIIDSILMRLVDALLSIPSFFLMLLLNAYLKPSIMTVIIIIGALSWMNIARLIRAETLTLKEREYVLYAKASGQSAMMIILKHIIPNVFPTMIVAATISIAGAIMMESALSFLGLGVQAPNASWGSMLNDARSDINRAPYLGLFPGMLILLTVLSFNMLGDLLRQAFDPKTRS
ncbi:ABC transporter permease [Thorsellia kenyensis]|uniref:ABC transporter permease n=1 Tax=Thorsellia kenyensis TaxID=1549888 RepID=A0ABV6C8F2_9GAMM